MFQIGLKKIFWLKTKVKNTVLWTYVISDLKSEEIARNFYKNKSQKTNQEDFRVKKVIDKKGDIAMLNGKATIVVLTVGLIKKTQYK